jgi:hypothetical protein
LVRRVVGARTAGAWNLATASLMFGRTIEDVKRAETLLGSRLVKKEIRPQPSIGQSVSQSVILCKRNTTP